ncbi:MAG: TSUP family transporter [Acidiferrobacterales bacterium]
MTNELIILLTLASVVSYSFEIVFGLAGTILMVMVMSFFLDAQTLVIYSVLPQILVATIGLYRTPGHVNRNVLLNMLGFAAVGALAGLALFYYFSPDDFRVLLAGAITAFGIYLVATPGRMKIKPLVARSLDTIAGVSQGLFGISGPIAMTRLLATFDNKTVIRNNALAFFLVLNLVRVGGYGINDTINDDIARAMLWSAPVLAVTLWFANHLHFKVNEAWFRRVVSWVILFGGVSLFLH